MRSESETCLLAVGTCAICEWSWEGEGAEGEAEAHHAASGHEVVVRERLERSVRLGPKGGKRGERREG